MQSTPKPQPHTRHVTRLFRSASPEQIAEGAQWYADANQVARALAVKNDVTLDIAAGVIAALSPLNSWGHNINLAARFLAAGGLSAGYLSVGLAKARAILAGADPVRTLKSQKIVNFYLSIKSSGAEGVCIDRHAYDIAVNRRHNDDTRPKVTGKRYEAVADCYKRAARILSRETGMPITAAQVQSVTWVLWRQRYWAVGAFDSHDHAPGEDA